MKRRLVPLLACLLLPAAAFAHVLDVHMTKVDLKADGDFLRARVEATAVAWMVEISGKVEDEGPWPADKLKLSMDYLRSNLPFSIDGRPLEGRLLRARYVREPWTGELSAVFVFDLLYPLPSTGTLFTAKSRIFVENWQENEGANPGAAVPGARDFRTRFSWSYLPGRARTATLEKPEISVPLKDLRRPRWEAWLESAALGFSGFMSLGGALALVLSAALFPPAAPAARGGLAAAALAAAAGAVLPGAWTGYASWAAVALLGLTSMDERRAVWWIGGLALGAAAAARLGVSAGAAFRDATAFARFSWAAYGAGFLAPLAAFLPLRRGVVSLHRLNFKYLTVQEYERQALFHRKLLSRFLALAGLYWVLSPFWAAAR